MDNIKYDFDDITLMPAVKSNIDSRSECMTSWYNGSSRSEERRVGKEC